MAQQARAGRGKRRGGSKTIMTAVLLIPVVAVLLPTCLILAVNMLPTIVAYFVDRTREKYLAITVGLLNFCGTLPAIAALWRSGQAYDVGMDIATDPFYWLLAYGSAGTAWAIYLMIPVLLANYYGATSSARLQSLRRRQQVLIETWGEEVAAREQDEAAG